MKRVLAVFLELVMIFTLCACGSNEPEPMPEVTEELVNSEPEPTPEVTEEPVNEEFVLRNDIRFLDSLDAVESKETLPFTEVRTIDNDSGEYVVWTERGTVAGYDETGVGFRFGNEYELLEMQYYFTDVPESSAEGRYEAIYEGLVRKYGEPLEMEEGKTHGLITSAFESANIFIAIDEITNGVGEIDSYHEWLIPVENNNYAYVKIDMVNYYHGKDYSNLDYELRVGYRAFTEDDVIDTATEMLEKKELIDQDL